MPDGSLTPGRGLLANMTTTRPRNAKRGDGYERDRQLPPGRRVIVLANRAPLTHHRSADGTIDVTRSASGVVTALEPIVEACGGTWVAHATGADDLEADTYLATKSEASGRSTPIHPYRVRYVDLEPTLYDGYYHGFANEGLWPLCHAVPVQPVFRADDFRMYREANRRFTDAVVTEAAGSSPLVLVQDYHFALAPRILQQGLARGSIITAFWHIPWPEARVLHRCPWAAQLIDGLLGSDLIGFQTEGDRYNFLQGVAEFLDADIRYSDDVVLYRGHSTRVRVYPVGVEWNNAIVRATPSADACRDRVYRDHHLPHTVKLGIGIDRLDYTKGIHEKFLAIERLLDRRPDVRPHFAFIQVAEPSRQCLSEYLNTRAQLEETARRVNARFGANGHQPIRLLEVHHEPAEVYELYRAADFCYVGSLHDGMNLVAKEFVCARTDERGFLVLSEFTGAARQLRAAVLVDPYAIDGTAHTLGRVLAMPPSEQAHRMRLLRANVSKFDSRWWRERLFEDALAAPRQPDCHSTGADATAVNPSTLTN
jgi:trehalose 6-phosphate synthase